MQLETLLKQHPFVPFIRECDEAIRSPWVFPERRLLDYLLIYFEKGTCEFWIDGETLVFEAGDVCLAQPGSVQVMRGLTDTITPFAHLDLFYNPLREDSFPTRPGQTDLSEYLHLMQPRLNHLEGIQLPYKLKPRHPKLFGESMKKLIQSWHDPHPLRQLEAQTIASELILELLRDNTKLNPQQASHASALGRLPAYLSQHLAVPISVEDMARRVNLSVSRFRTVFREMYGIPPHQFLMNLRLQHAEELLRTSDYTVEVIAEFCGFADIHHFSKAFKNKLGVSPSVHRGR